MSNINPQLTNRFTSQGPKRILSLDGGGIRGALTLGYLEKIENILRERHKHIIPEDKFRLHHYFDLIGGTSTGAIIAAALATGKSVAELKKLYRTLGRDIFGQKKAVSFTINLGFWKKAITLFTNYKYKAGPLKQKLQEVFGDSILGDNTNKTGLCVMAKRFDTFSTWPVTNNPNAKFFESNRFLIRNIVRASTAAPTYFIPEMIDVGGGEYASFVDGSLSMMNNPSFQLYLIATLKGYNCCGESKTWKTGTDDLFIVSVGTGRNERKLKAEDWKNPNLVKLAPEVAEQFLSDASEMVELMMQLLGQPAPGHKFRIIDHEIGDLETDKAGIEKLFTYVRYNALLTKNYLNAIGVTSIPDEQIESLNELDKADNVENLMLIGEKASENVFDSHFPIAFDIKTVYDEEIKSNI